MSTKQILIVGGLALAGYLAYKYITKPAAAAARSPGVPTQSGATGNLGTVIGGYVTTGGAILTGIEGLFGGGSAGTRTHCTEPT